MDEATTIEVVFATVLLVCGVSIFTSHFFAMPFFLRKVKKHDIDAYFRLNVAWLNIFDRVLASNMFFFLLRKEYSRLPPESHRLGSLLRYTWALPWVWVLIAMALFAIVILVFPETGY